MADYAQIIDGKVNMIVVEDDAMMDALNASGLDVRNVTNVDPKPSTGWELDGSVYRSPMMSWVRVDGSNFVTAVDEQIRQIAAQAEIDGGATLINMEEIQEIPQVGWTYDPDTGLFSE